MDKAIADFLLRQHSLQKALSALSTNIQTVHTWHRRGFLHLEKPGRGRAVYLSGAELLYLRCLVIVSKASHNPAKMNLRGLQESVKAFVNNCLDPSLRDYTKEYVCYRFVEHPSVETNLDVDGEWELSGREAISDLSHIVEGHGQKAVPYRATIELFTVLRELFLALR